MTLIASKDWCRAFSCHLTQVKCNMTVTSEAAFWSNSLSPTSFKSLKLQPIITMSGMFSIEISLRLEIVIFALRGAVSGFWKCFAGSIYVGMYDLWTVDCIMFGSNSLSLSRSLTSREGNEWAMFLTSLVLMQNQSACHVSLQIAYIEICMPKICHKGHICNDQVTVNQFIPVTFAF